MKFAMRFNDLLLLGWLSVVQVGCAGLPTEVSADESQAFMAPPAHVGAPGFEHHISTRKFQGISSLAVTPAGRIWVTWYAGSTPAEDNNNYVVLSKSDDGGLSWEEVLTVDPDGAGAVRAFDPQLWISPDGRLHLIWSQDIRGDEDGPNNGHDGSVSGVWFLSANEPDSPSPAWGEPRRVTDGIMMCKPIILSTGEWVLPVSTWALTDNSARMVVSTDQGETWQVRGSCHVPEADRTFDEHMFVERKDGTLWLLARTDYGIGESISTDRGYTWPELAPSQIIHPSARFFIHRLDSGNLLLIKHGPLDKKTGRSQLTAYLSEDDGGNWLGGLVLDERQGVSYPDGQQRLEDGLIYITYDYKRTDERNILMAVFAEDDVRAAKPVSPHVRLRQIVSNAEGVGMIRGEAPEDAPKRIDEKEKGAL